MKEILFTSNKSNTIMTKGEGMYLWDENGNKYLDFVAGWAVNVLGHSPEIITDVLYKQSKELLSCSPQFYNKKMIEFAKLLVDNSAFEKVFFTSTGAEANEGAIKLARKYGKLKLNGAYEIITLKNSFHGRTLATMSASGKEKFKELYEPKVTGFKHVLINDISDLKKNITKNTCAIMLELIQGEGGVNLLDEMYIKEVRKICDELKILLIFDEIQTGFGRTGKLFAYEHFNIIPDIMTVGKGIGGGLPLSAMLTHKFLDIFEVGDQGGTYCGNPITMAVGIAVLNEIIEKKLSINSQKMGDLICSELSKISKVKNIRGKGLLIAFELENIYGGKFIQKAMENGLLINSPKENTIRLFPAINIMKEHIDRFFELFKETLIQF